MKLRKIIYLLVTLVILAGLGYLAWRIYQYEKIKTINTFEDCVAAGYAVIKTNPEQCQTPDHRIFIKKTFNDYVKENFF